MRHEAARFYKLAVLAVLIFAFWVFCSLCSQITQTAIMQRMAAEATSGK